MRCPHRSPCPARPGPTEGGSRIPGRTGCSGWARCPRRNRALSPLRRSPCRRTTAPGRCGSGRCHARSPPRPAARCSSPSPARPAGRGSGRRSYRSPCPPRCPPPPAAPAGRSGRSPVPDWRPRRPAPGWRRWDRPPGPWPGSWPPWRDPSRSCRGR